MPGCRKGAQVGASQAPVRPLWPAVSRAFVKYIYLFSISSTKHFEFVSQIHYKNNEICQGVVFYGSVVRYFFVLARSLEYYRINTSQTKKYSQFKKSHLTVFLHLSSIFGRFRQLYL